MKSWISSPALLQGSRKDSPTNAKPLPLSSSCLQADASIHSHGKHTTGPGDGTWLWDRGTNLVLAMLGLNQSVQEGVQWHFQTCKKLEGNSSDCDILGCLERGFLFFISTGGKGGFSSNLDDSQECC